MIVVQAFYRLKSAGESWRSVLAQVLDNIGYKSTKADPNVWIRGEKKEKEDEYYEMVFLYVDDILSLSHKTKS